MNGIAGDAALEYFANEQRPGPYDLGNNESNEKSTKGRHLN
jgi:hypothetical protein